MENFTYTPLPPRTIRVLRLLPGTPGTPDAPLEGTLFEYPLPEPIDGEYPEGDYECVSYVWGDDAKPFRLTIDGRALPITASLDSLLRRLRNVVAPDPVRLWADAVCINQADPIEKGHQVALMRDIYGAASGVVVDLGEESNDLDLAVELMGAWWRKFVWSGIEVDGGVLRSEAAARFMGVQPPNEEERAAMEAVKLPDDRDGRWDAVARFFDRPWFSRLWVLQEFMMARRVVFICGEREVPWRDVVGASLSTQAGGMLKTRSASALSVYRRVSFGLMAAHRQIRLLPESCLRLAWLAAAGLNSKPRLVNLLKLLHVRKTSRRRDRYYALVGIAGDVHRDWPELQPDYISPIAIVVARFGRLLWNLGHGVMSLSSGGLIQQSFPGIPSWVLDFTGAAGSVRASTMDFTEYMAAGNTKFHFTMTRSISHLVTIRGLRVDVVDHGSHSELQPQSWLERPSVENQGQDFWRVLYEQLALNLRAVLGDITTRSPFSAQHFEEAVTSALMFGSGLAHPFMTDKTRVITFRFLCWLAVYRHLADDNGDVTFPAVYRMLEHECPADEAKAQQCKAVFRFFLLSAAWNRLQLAWTRRRRVASLPACSKRGDEVWVVQGVQVPLLLRKSTEYPGCYQLVGSCYVHGIMNGEALGGDYKLEQVTLC